MIVRKLMIGGAVCAAMVLGLVSGVGATTSPIALVLPQSAAFSILGHSCGGIQEQAFATGFDVTSGYPTGDVSLQTSCGGSGRGGGYHSTTYSAWVSVTWDFTGAVVSSAVLTAAPTNTDPTFSAYDPYGNEVYNASSSAFLVLAPTFIAPPRVTGISATVGPAAGGTSLTIAGTGFTGATAVSFGATPAASFSVAGDTSITAVSPSAPAGTVDVTVTTAGGTSSTSTSDQFTLVAAPTVSNVGPSSGPVAGGTSVTITGIAFTGATAVSFGGTATSFTVNDDTSITAVSPAVEEADTVHVTVTTPGGTSAAGAASQFTFTSATGCGSSCVASVQCAKLSGSATGTLTVSKCAPKSAANRSATLPPLSGTFTWSKSRQTTVGSLSDPTSPGQGGCKPGSTEYDYSGLVTGGTSTYTAVGDAISAQTCVSSAGALSLVKGTTFDL